MGPRDLLKSPDSATKSMSPLLSSLFEASWDEDKTTIATQIAEQFFYDLARRQDSVDDLGMFLATAKSLRHRLTERYNKTQEAIDASGCKEASYLCIEWLLGRAMTDVIYNLKLKGPYYDAVKELGFNLEDLLSQETEAGMGSGGLGRLSACFISSATTLSLPFVGYGLRYRYGMFKQVLENGYQVEYPDYWLRHGDPWELERFDIQYPVKFYGNATSHIDAETGEPRFDWNAGETVIAVAYDYLIPGYNTNNVNAIRLWEARPSEEFRLSAHISGDYNRAVVQKQECENLTSVLYPSDFTYQGKELRLKQQYLFVSASLQDMIKRCLNASIPLERFDEKFAVHLNDTHPSLAVPELMRLFMDEYGLGWSKSWEICNRAFCYTNHTVLPEALETWSVGMLSNLLPRHMDIIKEINRRWLCQVAMKYPNDASKISRLSILSDDGQNVRMANLAIVGSKFVNGVAAIHTEILKKTLFKDFYEIWPNKFVNKTNGVTIRRWLAECNPELSALISDLLVKAGVCKNGDEWVSNASLLKNLIKYSNDVTVLDKFWEIKKKNKEVLADKIFADTKIKVDPTSIFDIQVKRIHEYKRQFMNILSVIVRWKEIHSMDDAERKKLVPRTVIIAGKAAAAYQIAKKIIRLCTAVAHVINDDPVTSKYLKLVFLPDYSVSLAEIIFPACELSEQISCAGMEASGTGNMKATFNSAVIIGTHDGANVEIGEAVGDDNLLFFGLTDDEVLEARTYLGSENYERNSDVELALNLIRKGIFGCTEYLSELCGVLDHDWYMIHADFEEYHDLRWDYVDEIYKDKYKFAKMMLSNTALSYPFSSDRSIAEYATEMWNIKPIKAKSGQVSTIRFQSVNQ